MIAGIAGHGPGAWGEKRFPGIMQGGDVVWVAQDYPNLTTVMWREEFVPRFRDKPWATLNGQDHFISVHGKGTLYLRSAEAISGIRGIGKKLKGVIVDEAAHLDLEMALKDVILPALLDNGGWLVLMSTTNAAGDGNTAKRVPSYFNLICEEIRAGKRSTEWEEFTGTAYDNPAISDAGIDELVKEYAPGSPALQQEVYAELLRAGVGLALPQVVAERHIVDRFPIPEHWTQFGAFDWGFNHPWCFGWFVADGDGNIYLVDTVWGREDLPDAIALKINATVPVKRLQYIHAGHDIKADRKARGERVPTLQESFAAKGIHMLLANISRVSGLENLRAYVNWEATDVTPEREPRFKMFRTDGNQRVLETLQMMQVDPKDLEDALKVDADYAGRGGDDGYDMVRYGLASRPMLAKAPHQEADVKVQDRAARFDFAKGQFVRPAEPTLDRVLNGGRVERPYRMPSVTRRKG